jgi:DNA modification methylase
MAFTDPPWNVAIGLDSNPRHRQRKGLINDNLGKDFPAFLAKVGEALRAAVKKDIYVVMGCAEWPNIHAALVNASFHWSSTVIWAKDVFVLGRSNYHRKYEPIWYGWQKTSSYRGDRKQDDLWEFDRPTRSPEHPTMKPVELVERALHNSSVKGDTVLDLFGGSGTTLLACEKTGRRCRMIELEPGYCQVIIDRWEQFTGAKATPLRLDK